MTESSRPVRPPRWWDLPAALLALAALLTAALRLAATNWTSDLPLTETLAFFGFAAGLALGQSVFTRRTTSLLALAYGLFAIPWQLGLTMDENILWSERMLSLWGRLVHTTGDLIRQEPVTDPILFLFLMAALFWALGVQAGYTLTRHGQSWQAILPTGLALFVIHIHDPYWPYRTWYLAAYLFFSLLLVARMTFLSNYSKWRHTNTRLPPYLGLDLIRTTLLATAVIVLMAWTAPALASSVPAAERAWGRFSRPWAIMRSRMTNAFASLQASVGLINEYYGETLPLGRGNPLADSIVFTVEAPTRPSAGVRYYWRARVYDEYDRGWTSTFDDTRQVTPQRFELNFPELEGRWDATFRFTPQIPFATLYTVPQPVWVSRPAQVDAATNPDGTIDLASIHAVDYLRAGETYEVRSSVTAATISDLRAAGTDYPEWVTERYLQLPPDITDRTRELAQRLTEDLESPYDKAKAVTDFLRDHITYSETIPEQPADQEPIDWILFDLRQGFCNYYATAEVVMLRAVGVPSRMAVGYAQGERDSETDLYFVRQRDLHAWPEVYFPGIGWAEFEPTLNQRPLVRPSGEDIESEASNNPDLSEGEEVEEDRTAELDELLNQEGEPEGAGNVLLTGADVPVSVLLSTLAIGLIAVALFAWRRGRARDRVPPLPVLIETSLSRFGLRAPQLLRRWAYLAQLSPLERAYLELNRALGRVGAPAQPHDTPAERAARLSRHVPDLSEPSRQLVSEYHAWVYGGRSADHETAQSAARNIRNLSWLALFQRLLSRWQEPRRRPSFADQLPG